MTPELSVQSSASIGVHCHDTNAKGIEIHQLKKKNKRTNNQTKTREIRELQQRILFSEQKDTLR